MSLATLGFSAMISVLPIAKCGLLQRAAVPWQLHVYRPVGKWLKSHDESKGESGRWSSTASPLFPSKREPRNIRGQSVFRGGFSPPSPLKKARTHLFVLLDGLHVFESLWLKKAFDVIEANCPFVPLDQNRIA